MVAGDECRYCDAHSVVPVLDKSIERGSTRGGNKYRRRCLSCERWLPMTSGEHYRNHLHPHVLPMDKDTEVVPLEDYDYGPEWSELVERVTGSSGPTGPESPEGSAPTDPDGNPAVTDGGVDPDDDPDDEESVENEFTCPYSGCDAEHTGFPDRCSACGAVYNW